MASLLPVEADELRRHEAIIESGLQSSYASLMAIRDGELYRRSHETFEAYCEDRWGIRRSRAYQLIDTAKVNLNLSTNGGHPGLNERQARPLAPLPVEQQVQAWELAQESAPNGKPTARHVEAAVAVVTGRPGAADLTQDTKAELRKLFPSNGHPEPVGSFNRPLPGQLSLLPEAEPDEPDPDDAPGPWDKFFERMIEFFVSLPRRGGVRGLTQDWSAKKREASLVHLEKLHALTGQFIAELRGL
jgi:hypothetical protein